jgi:hypothetical protein
VVPVRGGETRTVKLFRPRAITGGAGPVEVPTSALPARDLVESYQAELAASYVQWQSALLGVRNILASVGQAPNPGAPGNFPEALHSIEGLKSWSQQAMTQVQLARDQNEALQTAISPVATLGVQVREILDAKRREAELQVVIVNAFPPDRVSEVTGVAAATLAAGGGVAFQLVPSDHTVALVLWSFAAALFAITVAARIAHQREWRGQYKRRLEGL